MDFPNAFFHLSSFAAPAFAVGLLVVLASRWILPRPLQSGSVWRSGAINFIVGVGVLMAGLAWFGVDGKMMTYAAMVVSIALVQWVRARGWKG